VGVPVAVVAVPAVVVVVVAADAADRGARFVGTRTRSRGPAMTGLRIAGRPEDRPRPWRRRQVPDFVVGNNSYRKQTDGWRSPFGHRVPIGANRSLPSNTAAPENSIGKLRFKGMDSPSHLR
jgi:hypothetical protein